MKSWDYQFNRICYAQLHNCIHGVDIKYQIAIFSKTNEKIYAIFVNIRLIKIENRWKYSVKECLFDGNIIFVLKGSHEKNMFVLNGCSI